MSENADIKWLAPWQGGLESDSFAVDELQREVGPQHVLFGVPARAVARRQDCDDILFELLDGSGRFAVVHLTFTKKTPESDPSYPNTEIYRDWSHFHKDRMVDDHDDWTRDLPDFT